MKIHRTYPQPDSPEMHLGPRERAMGVYKYILDMEPEAAIKHPGFQLMVHAFEQMYIKGWNDRLASKTAGVMHAADSLTPLLDGTVDLGDVRVQKFAKDGL